MKVFTLAFSATVLAVLVYYLMKGTATASAMHPELDDPAAFVVGARGLIISSDDTHVEVAHDKLPAALKRIAHVRVEVAKDHVDFITFKEPDGELGYRVWKDKPAAAANDRGTKWPDVFFLNVDFGKPAGTPENFP